ncbi:MAG: glycine cleavage system protein GcvH [Proteobacteria bacterium]|nr:glycine cleavage system protein GcvH [Pseudomonadota bacterium]
MATFPANLRYTKDHEWASDEGDVVRIGITSFAVEQLGDITLVDLPEPQTTLEALAHFGDIESVKAVSELFAPISGEIVEINDQLQESPELVNEAPYGEGWMVLIRPTDKRELKALMDADAYEQFVGTLES